MKLPPLSTLALVDAFFPRFVVHLLASVDAVVIPGLLIFWVTTWPGKGGLLGATVVVLLCWWAGRRLARSLLALDSYRWTAGRAMSLVLFGAALKAAAWLFHR